VTTDQLIDLPATDLERVDRRRILGELHGRPVNFMGAPLTFRRLWSFVRRPGLLVSLADDVIYRVRFRLFKLIYDGICFVVVRAWQKPLRASLEPRASDRILDFSASSGSTAVTFARDFPQANFVAADPNPKAVKKARRNIARHQIPNVTVIAAPLHGRLPFDADSFDRIISVLAFHDRIPDDRLSIAKELLRVLRRGGTLHVADFDKAATHGEGRILIYTERISGRAAAEPHINGSWTAVLKKAGFTGIRSQSSFSVGVGRITVVTARKR